MTRHDITKPYEFQGMSIPVEMLEAIDRYVTHGITPGSFLTAVLDNDFSQAVGRADSQNMRILPAYAAYIYNEIPSQCWGSREKVNAWIDAKQEREPNP